jgi:hypothetical protein
MAGSVLSGYVMAALRADQLWQQLSPQPGLAAGDVPEVFLPPFVFLRDREEKTVWVASPRRIVTHTLEADVYAKGAVQAGAENPAEVLAAHLERVLNNPVLDLGVPNAVPVTCLQKLHRLTEEKQRADDKSRVYHVELLWEVVLYRTA